MTLKEQHSTPPLYGLVLAGGKSQRMGTDKSTMQWHGKEQRYYMADLLQTVCSKVFISCRAEQQTEIDKAYTTLPDSYEGAGPIIAIMSAFEAHPTAAWLIVACDLPLLDAATLQYLVQHRNTAKIATTFKSPFDGLPEPLITIWEPGSADMIQHYYTEGFKCPRKMLIKSEEQVLILLPPDANALMNANTPEDAEQAKAIINQTIQP